MTELSGYRFVWLIAMFDLPTTTKTEKRDHAKFRKNLLTDGFRMFQYSVYGRHCASYDNADVHSSRVQRFLPNDGEVRLLTITDKQFERMRIFWGKKRTPQEQSPMQLELL